MPTRIEVSATNDDSSRNAACTMRRRKPIARMTPICCLRSTTARALMTPSAATPTTRPSPMNPWINRLNVRLAATASSTTCWIDSASSPLARKAVSSSAAVSSRVHSGGEPEVVDRRLDAARERLHESLLRGRDADHLERRRVLEDADDGETDAVPGLLVEDLDRDRVEPLLEVEAGQLEVRKHAEVPVVAARDDRAVHDGEPRLARERRSQTSCSDVVAPRDVAQPERRVLEERRCRARGRGRSRTDVLPPTCFASTASTDWLPTAVKSRHPRPGARRSAPAMSSIGAVPVVPARTWNPPPKSSTSMAWTNEPFDAVPVTSVNTTRVNMASVVPVRKRAASG